MNDWNFAPNAPAHEAVHRRLLWRAGVLMFCAVVGAGGVGAWTYWLQQEVESLQIQWQSAQAQLTSSEQSLQQAQTQFAQRQPLVAEHRYAQALRQRGRNLQTVMASLARQWPGGVLIQELRLQGDALQLQGRTDSSQALAQGLQALSVGVVWQQAPSLQTLERLPSDQQGLRFVAQGRWPNIEIPALSAENSGPAKTAPSKSAAANVSTTAKE